MFRPLPATFVVKRHGDSPCVSSTEVSDSVAFEELDLYNATISFNIPHIKPLTVANEAAFDASTKESLPRTDL